MLRARSTSRRISARRRFLVEPTPVSGEHAVIAEQVLDHGLGVRPIHCAGRRTPRTPQSVMGGQRMPGVAGEVLMSTRDSTLSGKSSARSCANAPPAETPTMWAARTP